MEQVEQVRYPALSENIILLMHSLNNLLLSTDKEQGSLRFKYLGWRRDDASQVKREICWDTRVLQKHVYNIKAKAPLPGWRQLCAWTTCAESCWFWPGHNVGDARRRRWFAPKATIKISTKVLLLQFYDIGTSG